MKTVKKYVIWKVNRVISNHLDSIYVRFYLLKVIMVNKIFYCLYIWPSVFQSLIFSRLIFVYFDDPMKQVLNKKIAQPRTLSSISENGGPTERFAGFIIYLLWTVLRIEEEKDYYFTQTNCVIFWKGKNTATSKAYHLLECIIVAW